ncbi:MAG: sigma-70 family RNA polymerase sigma factor [Bacteroidota bacterium]
MKSYKPSSETDVSLWDKFRDGNIEAYEELYKRHFTVLYRYGLKLGSDREPVQDCIHDLFFGLWTKRSRLGKVQSVKFYLLKSFKRDLIRTITKVKTTEERLALIPDLIENIVFSGEDLMAQAESVKEKTEVLAAAVNALPPRERQVIYMRFYMELSYEEICEALSLSYQVVLNYMHRALKNLRANNMINRNLVLVAAFFGLCA